MLMTSYTSIRIMLFIHKAKSFVALRKTISGCHAELTDCRLQEISGLSMRREQALWLKKKKNNFTWPRPRSISVENVIQTYQAASVPGMLQNYTFPAARTRVDRGLCFPGWVTVGPTASPKYSVPGARAAAWNLSMLTLILRGIQFVSSAAENWTTS